MTPIAIRARDLTKRYVVHDGPRLLAHELADLVRGRQRGKELVALDRVSYELERGKTLGVIGINGAGKSTMLRLIAGISEPTSGSVEVDGRVASLLEFGAGFEPRLSARENILLNGVLLGIPRSEVRRDVDAILDFAELTEHADSPLFTFSSGMSMRLGFAIAIRTRADVLLFDEILAVGDVSFQAKCFKELERFKREGKTLVFVSHDLYDVGNVCDEVLLLNHGKVAALGAPQDVIQRYWSTLVREESRATLECEQLRVDFINGKLYVWDGPRQLTKGFCGYTSVRSFVRWHESDKATWRVVERSPTKIVAEGTSWGLPLLQRWTLELEGPRLLWSVDFEASAVVQLERQQANFMWSEKYDRYSVQGGAPIELGGFRAALDDDWEVVRTAPTDAGPIGLSSTATATTALPSVSLACTKPREGCELAVVNSDTFFRARLLQYRSTARTELEPGVSVPFFRGVLDVKRPA